MFQNVKGVLSLLLLLLAYHSPAPVTGFSTHAAAARVAQKVVSTQFTTPSKSPYDSPLWRCTRSSPSALSSTANKGEESSQNNSNNNNRQRRRQQLQRLVQTLLATPQKAWIRFSALSKRAKRIIVMQMAVIMMIFGALTKSVVTKSHLHHNNMVPPPIEISYSKFLSLVEMQSQHDKSTTMSGTNSLAPESSWRATSHIRLQDYVPFLDQVRIGRDKIYFNIYEQTPPSDTQNVVGEIVSDNTAASKPALTYRTKRLFPGVYMTQKVPAPGGPTTTVPGTDPEKQVSVIRAYTRQIPSTVASPELLQSLQHQKIGFAALSSQPAPPNLLANALRTFMAGFYCLILWRLYRTMSNATGNNHSDTPGKLANALTSDLPLATFDDIQGMDQVKLEVMELVDTLRHPDKYAILGARAPTGLLLEGPPGTGKTMLARATAATVGVPLLYCSGSDFVEMFVGRGASRVRKLFERASKLAPCIIFIDELDALGKSRDMGGPLGGMGMRSGSNDEAEQTLNQLLACMDGLDSTRRICVLAATNRKEVLDPALLRPGRLDRIVKLSLPDAAGREKILRVHCQKLPGFSEGQGVDPARSNSLGRGKFVDLSAIAAVTNGLSGAELEFIVNEAAIRAVRRVTAQLRNSQDGLTTTTRIANGEKTDRMTEQKIVPHVEAIDFEASVQNFIQTRRKGGSTNWFANL
eukprot:CAMPEP_0172439544 /NCGR_PEP_ID=MMETSP1065-20121228/494_1 /TAXON_ID=265537 /ORGANISM="Amphiprora paludosa, Strain CCMP125" /LENGTH=693 /DNA_ID=CAMNT_0013188239 /DNA_START=99 /DNA_END=2180 /DNA_ORIENTATION=-